MMGVIPFPSRATTHGQRDTAGDILPAGGTARPVPPPSGRADLPHYAGLRDGDLLPREPMGCLGVIFWGVMIAAGFAFWAFVGGPALFWLFDMLAGWL